MSRAPLLFACFVLVGLTLNRIYSENSWIGYRGDRVQTGRGPAPPRETGVFGVAYPGVNFALWLHTGAVRHFPNENLAAACARFLRAGDVVGYGSLSHRLSRETALFVRDF